MNAKSCIVLALCSFVLAGSGCGDDKADETADTSSTTTATTGTTGTTETGCPEGGVAMLRFAHMAVDVANVDVHLNGDKKPLFTDLGYMLATAYAEVPSGISDVAMNIPGPGTKPAGTISLAKVPLCDGGMYTVAAYGRAGKTVGAQLFNDGLTNLADGEARLNMFHAAYDVGEIDVWDVTDAGAPFEIVSNVGYGVGDRLDLPEGSFVLALDTDDDGVPEFEYGAALFAGMVFDVLALSEGYPNVFIGALFPDGTIVRLDAE